MTLKGMIYEAKDGTLWFVRQESLPKKKGEYKFWVADQVHINIFYNALTFKADLKGDLLDQINDRYDKAGTGPEA